MKRNAQSKAILFAFATAVCWATGVILTGALFFGSSLNSVGLFGIGVLTYLLFFYPLGFISYPTLKPSINVSKRAVLIGVFKVMLLFLITIPMSNEVPIDQVAYSGWVGGLLIAKVIALTLLTFILKNKILSIQTL